MDKCEHIDIKLKWFRHVCVDCGRAITIEELLRLIEELRNG